MIRKMCATHDSNDYFFNYFPLWVTANLFFYLTRISKVAFDEKLAKGLFIN